MNQDYRDALKVLRGDAQLPDALMNYPIVYALEKAGQHITHMPSIETINLLIHETGAMKYTRSHVRSILMKPYVLLDSSAIGRTRGFRELFELIKI